MKPRYFSYAALVLVGGAALTLAQGPGRINPQLRMDQFYVQRELRAPQNIKASLASLRASISQNNQSFTVGYTDAMDYSLSSLAGMKPLPDDAALSAAQAPQTRRMLEIEDAEIRRLKIDVSKYDHLKLAPPSPSMRKVDWRNYITLSPMQNQASCGSCWAFGTMGALEGSWYKRNGETIDTSEQQVLSCSGAGNCLGGWPHEVLPWLMTKGVARESSIPYAATNGSTSQQNQWCDNTPGVYKASAWGHVATGRVATTAEIKQALCDHGPLCVGVRATPAFQAYTGGVFDENNTGNLNHAITLIGWDDDKGAWIIRNSWGKNWGETCGKGTEKGYMYIKYGSNKVCSYAMWVDAARKQYQIDPDLYKQILRQRPLSPDILRRINL